MTRNGTQTDTKGCNHQRQSHGDNFSKVLNGRKQPIRALWVRNGRYYAQLRIEDPLTGIKKTRRVAILDGEGQPVATVPAAVEQLRSLQTKRSENTLPVLQQHPKFRDYLIHHLQC